MKGKRAEKDVQAKELENLKLQVAQIQEAVSEPETEEIMEDVELPENKPTDTDKTVNPLDKILTELGDNQGWIHVKLRRDLTGTTYKIGRFRPAEFNADALAQEFGGGTYFYDVRNEKGKRILYHEEHYLSKDKGQNNGNTDDKNNVAMSQAFDLIKELTAQITELKAEINKPKEADKDTILSLVTAINQQQQQAQQQQFEMLKTILTAQATASRPQTQNTMQDFLNMFNVVKNLMPEPQKVESEPKNSVADTIALFNAISELKETGVEPKTDWKDVAMKFLTDGSVINLINNLKQKPIIEAKEPTAQQPITQQPVAQQPVATETAQQPVAQLENGQTPNTPDTLTQAKLAFVQVFKNYEKAIFDLKVQGQNAEDVANNILSICEMNKDLNQVCYIITQNTVEAVNLIMNNTQLFVTDKQFVEKLIKTMHDYYYTDNENTEDDGQDTEDTDTQNEVIATSQGTASAGDTITSDKPQNTQQGN